MTTYTSCRSDFMYFFSTSIKNVADSLPAHSRISHLIDGPDPPHTSALILALVDIKLDIEFPKLI